MGRKHHTPERIAEGDRVSTPAVIAADMIAYFKPAGVILEPFKGDGAIYNLLPPGSPWCEITEGVDFFLFDGAVDWVFTNPPYSKLRVTLKHCIRIARNIVLLIPARNLFAGYGTVRETRGWGGIKAIRWYGTGSSLGFPMGNAIAAIHWERDHFGTIIESFYEDDMDGGLI